MKLMQTVPGTRVEAPEAPRLGRRRQRTLARSTLIQGVGMVTGSRVSLRFCPAPPDSGIHFHRTDIRDARPIPARVEAVTGTARRTTLGSGPNQVTLVEHVLAALAGMRIDNCLIELDGPEPPGLDGSSDGYVDCILNGGVALQHSAKPTFVVREPVTVSHGGATLTIYPRSGEDLVVSYLLDFGPGSPIMPQSHTEIITPDRFRQNVSKCRTFVLEHEAEELKRRGVGRHLSNSEVLVFGPRGLIDNRLRFPDEPARHKILDIVGDLALSGLELVGHVVAYRSGHPLNVELAKELTRLAKTAGAAW